MAEVQQDPFILMVEQEEERRTAIAAESAAAAEREHEYRLAKLEYATQPRYKSVERAIVGLAKVLALPIAVICVGILAAKDKEVPESLAKFLTI